ncbi:hypothetical protein PACTADRAFT_41467 [Pachysolen tannophilus NRRL Y-2460]|uniref:Pre-mRNA-splicing factor 3 domain-containing protein n=1 Tax=Pachysolen tannophilus NRRL Y-2460 TaxID=669874 RepID=A0A1E4TVR3_PACTA|nr:hypothetical protein PACTADRAFT_41467 [Pachysolen tannophilus NRRL Y-2460]
MFSKNVPTRPRRDLKFNEKGKYINKAIELREAEKLAHEEELRSQEIRKMGLEPDISIGENLYRAVQPPNVEWWDKPLLKENSYDQIENVSKLTYMEISEDNPITHYIQFPVPINLSSGQMNAIIEPKIYLTKKELKKKRKIDRQTKLKREQELIRAGLLPPPPPKVKLKNLMSVLTNEAIKDPTAVEQKVKAEIEQRRLIHEKDNLERKLSKKSTTDKTQIRQENDLNKFGIFSNIFKIDHLVNSKHFYKLNVNAAQLNLKGVIIRLRERENFALVIIEGTLKNVEHYQKLMLRRINWKENVISKVKQIEQLNKDQVQEDIDLSKNKCSLIWEGQIKEFHFNKWSVPSIDTESDAINYLSRFNLDTYWRIAEAITDDDDD